MQSIVGSPPHLTPIPTTEINGQRIYPAVADMADVILNLHTITGHVSFRRRELAAQWKSLNPKGIQPLETSKAFRDLARTGAIMREAEAIYILDTAILIKIAGANAEMTGYVTKLRTPERQARMQIPEAQARVTEYTVSCLPAGHEMEIHFSVTVVECSPGRWAVKHHVFTYDVDGQRSYEPITTNREDDYIDRHRFELDEALSLARRVAPTLRVNRFTVADVLALADEGQA